MQLTLESKYYHSFIAFTIHSNLCVNSLGWLTLFRYWQLNWHSYRLIRSCRLIGRDGDFSSRNGTAVAVQLGPLNTVVPKWTYIHHLGLIRGIYWACFLGTKISAIKMTNLSRWSSSLTQEDDWIYFTLCTWNSTSCNWWSWMFVKYQFTERPNMDAIFLKFSPD